MRLYPADKERTMTGRAKFQSVAWTVIAMLALLTGCGGGDYGHGDSHGDAASHEAATPAVLDLTVEAQAILATADLADGTEDNVVSKCPGCNLAMDGSAEHVAHVGEYELHFCSAGCSEKFQEDTNAAILALATP
jgi:hypothetical protein